MFLLVCFVLILSYKSPHKCMHVTFKVGRRPCIKPSGVLDCMHGCYILIWSHVANRHSNCDNEMNSIIRCIQQHVSGNQLTRKSSNMSIPIRSMGLVYLPYIYHKINHSKRYIYHTWILWDMSIRTTVPLEINVSRARNSSRCWITITWAH